MTTLVWLKRDLRLADHAPLAAAARAPGPVMAVFAVEPQWLASPEFDAQHLAFALQSLVPLRDALAARGLPLLLHHGPVLPLLAALQRQHGLTHLFSHEETGPRWTWDRDRAVAAWCRAHGVAWTEWPQTGVVRRLRDRRGWAGRWQRRMDAAPAAAPARFDGLRLDGAPIDGLHLDPARWPTLAALGVHGPMRPLPAAGEAAAQATLQSFLHRRGADYRRSLSSPLSAEQGCSRLSAHLAFGTLSLRQVHQATEARIAAAAASTDVAERRFVPALRAFAGRLRWHCHFMQKLEDEPDIEFRNFSRACDGLRPGDVAGGGAPFGPPERERFEAWCEGRTGFPMVDACMRSLRATGWLNFRMRAMLVSFASYHLWLHWRDTGLHLARQFLDFEPGIHWSQMQMQSGTTGINTLRMYSPTKQALDHDPQGLFRQRWLPELGSGAYPAPIVDEGGALAAARGRLYALRGTAPARAEADAIQHRHGSRRSGLAPTRKRRAAAPDAARQGDLFAALHEDA